MIWVKAFHIVFMVTWFAGLFYLPRLFIYHTETTDEAGRQRFETMERKLFVIMTIGAAGTVGLGLWLMTGWYGALWQTGWMIAKLLLVAALLGNHVYCRVLMGELKQGRFNRSGTWLRWFNETPAIALIAIVLLVELQP